MKKANNIQTLVFHLNNGEKFDIDTSLSADEFIKRYFTDAWLATYDNSNRLIYVKILNIAYIEVKPK